MYVGFGRREPGQGIGLGVERGGGDVDAADVPVAGLVAAGGELADAPEVTPTGWWHAAIVPRDMARCGTDVARAVLRGLTGRPLQAIYLDFSSTPNGIRTRAAALKGRCPRPLDDGGGTLGV